MHTIAQAGLGSAAKRVHIPARSQLRGVIEIIGGCDPALPGRVAFPAYPTPGDTVAAPVTIATARRRLNIFLSKLPARWG